MMIMQFKKTYDVKYEDGSGCEPETTKYETEEEANDAIRYDLADMISYYSGFGLPQWKNMPNDYGNITTEVWVRDHDKYARWIRMWGKENEHETEMP